MVHMPVSEFKNEIAETLNRVMYVGERVLLQRHGKDVAALVSMKEFGILEALEQLDDEQDVKDAVRILQRIKSGDGEVVSWDDAKKQLGL